uniref:C2H2-type domain-containing protein n=1 Tax=Anopheles maculatus TaxID=74869 RepID=A0A182SRG0_9DIPT
MCSAAGSLLDWFVDADDDGCDMLPLIAGNDSSVIAEEVTFEASEFLPPAFDELPYAADFVLYGDHHLFTEIDRELVAETNDQKSTTIATVLVCDTCNLRFKCKSHLTRHQLLLHEDGSDIPKGTTPRIQCRQCDDSFASAKQLKLHFETQHPQRLICDLCLTAFHNEASLEWHRNYHLSKENQKENYVCDICQKQCASS